MKITSSIKLFICFALLSFASFTHAGKMLFTDHPLAGKIWDTNSRSFIDEPTLLARNKTATVLLLGETHDNPIHHDIQLKLLKALIDSGAGPASMPALMPALMMEQLNVEDQAALDQALTGSNRDEVLNSVTKLIKFNDAQFYSPFLAFAIDNKLPVIAANVPNQQLQPVISHGFGVYDAGDLKRLAVEEVWSESRQSYLYRSMGGAHCGQMKDEMRAGLTRSQRLRDALMVDSALSSVGRGVVAIVGSSHARRDIGLPLYFSVRAPQARILSIGLVEVSPGRTDPKAYAADSATGDAPYDVIWFTPRVERADPCAEMRKSKEKK